MAKLSNRKNSENFRLISSADGLLSSTALSDNFQDYVGFLWSGLIITKIKPKLLKMSMETWSKIEINQNAFCVI